MCWKSDTIHDDSNHEILKRLSLLLRISHIIYDSAQKEYHYIDTKVFHDSDSTQTSPEFYLGPQFSQQSLSLFLISLFFTVLLQPVLELALLGDHQLAPLLLINFFLLPFLSLLFLDYPKPLVPMFLIATFDILPPVSRKIEDVNIDFIDV
jgi:hypothetical protein